MSADENTVPGIKVAIKAFMAGAVLPTIGVALAYGVLWHIKALHDVLPTPFYIIPILWGIWNVAYAWIKDDVPNLPIGLWGAILGLIIASTATFIYNVPVLLGISTPVAYIFPAIAPAAYFLVWRYVVSFLNSL
jgi:hypothetical protein